MGTRVAPGLIVAAAPDGEKHEPSLAELLRVSERKTQAFFHTLADLFVQVRKDGVILDVRVPKDFGFPLTEAEIKGRRVAELLPSQIGPHAMHYVEKALRTGEPQLFAWQMALADRVHNFEARIAACGSGEVMALVRDLTDQKLHDREILEISSREQTRIGQDLHDGLGQHLTGITFLSKALERKLAAQSLPEATEAAEISRLVCQALAQTRSLARGLFPVELESNGLVPAFKELTGTVENLFAISCQLDCDDSVVVHDRTVATHIFRLVQEAINNSVKHGKARRVVIALRQSADTVELSVADDGVGFSAADPQAKGLGLRIMNYRAQKAGGTLEIRPGEPGGTVVRCSFRNPQKNIELSAQRR